MSKNTILITGINGFLGSNLAKRFSKSYNIVGTEYSLENLYRIKEYDFPVYLSDHLSICKLFAENKVDIVIHTATFYGRNNEDVSLIAESNLFTPFSLLDQSIKNKIDLFINTDTALEKFTSTYALAKKQFREWLEFCSKDLKIINLQLEHFYGPGASNLNFITAMITRLLNNEHQINLTLGEQKRDFIYYEDVLDVFELVINLKVKLLNNFNHFEVGSGELISIKELMISLKDLTGSNSVLNFGYIPYRENEIMESKADIAKISSLGFGVKHKLAKGLNLTIEYLKNK